MSQKSITVLIGIYQAGDFIKAKVNNIMRQTAIDNCNIVFLNCQNLHNERESYRHLLNGDNIHEILYNQHVKLYPTWNDGIRLTNSEFIINSNVDDMLHPDCLKLCADYLRAHPQYACVSTGVLMTVKPNQSDYTTWEWEHPFPLYSFPLSTAGPCPMWRKSLHTKYGYFGNYNVIGDARMWELWLAGGEQFGLIKDYLVLYFLSGNSLERRRDAATGLTLRELDLR